MGKPKKGGKTALKTDFSKAKELPGKAVKYIGILGRTFTCPTCGKTGSRMLIWEHGGEAYCSRTCIPTPDKEIS